MAAQFPCGSARGSQLLLGPSRPIPSTSSSAPQYPCRTATPLFLPLIVLVRMNKPFRARLEECVKSRKVLTESVGCVESVSTAFKEWVRCASAKTMKRTRFSNLFATPPHARSGRCFPFRTNVVPRRSDAPITLVTRQADSAAKNHVTQMRLWARGSARPHLLSVVVGDDSGRETDRGGCRVPTSG